jgi:hypothetical protein|tara:strand:+ start:39 stop:689 length:651 start_codon:yes stop_codon:yes gene_type:complete
MNKINPIIWYDNVPIDEELLSDTINSVKQGDVEYRHGDSYYTSYFKQQDNQNGADSIFERYYAGVVNRLMIDLGLEGRSTYSIATWMQVYDTQTRNSMRVHDHWGGGELVSWVHFVRPSVNKLFYFIDSNGKKLYPDVQNKDDFIVFPPFLQHGVDPNNDSERVIIAGNVMLHEMYSQEGRDYHKVNYIDDNINFIQNIPNKQYKHKQRHSELDSL